MEVVFKITIQDLKQIILKKDESILNCLIKINHNNCITVQQLQSQVQDAVVNKEKHEEMQGQANHESREASAPGFAPTDPSIVAEAPPEEILPIPMWQPFVDKPIDECIANIRCEGNCIHTACGKTQPQNVSEPNVIWYNCNEEFLTKNKMMDTREAVTILLGRSVTNLTVRNESAGMSIRL